MRTYALLLEERKPTRAMLRSAPRLRMPVPLRKEPDARPRKVCREDFPPEVQVLFGGGTTLVCDARGGGFLAHNGLMFTRRRQDPLHQGGIQF